MNLNDLSEEKLNELEKYLNCEIGRREPEIQILFQHLRNGKLKNKNVDTDALDFVYNGLTNLVENWMSGEKQQEEPMFAAVNQGVDLKSLFARNCVFRYEGNQDLGRHVEQLLSQNNFPKRSGPIKISGTQKPNPKFIRDGFIYLLRGAEAGQMSGFFAYPYCQLRMNLQEYCRRNPHLTPNSMLEKHSQIGKGYFISATTKLPLTTKFCHKVGDKAGSVYILKMKPEEVYRLKPHKPDLVPQFMDLQEFNEEEYIIPDYVVPNELVKEFEYTDYRGVFQYLKEVIGLNITPQDVGFSGDIEREKAENIKKEDFFREVEEKIVADWEKGNYGKMFATIMEEFSKQTDNEGR